MHWFSKTGAPLPHMPGGHYKLKVNFREKRSDQQPLTEKAQLVVGLRASRNHLGSESPKRTILENRQRLKSFSKKFLSFTSQIMELIPCSLIRLLKSLLTEGKIAPSNRSLRAAECFCATVLTKEPCYPALLRNIFPWWDSNILSPGTQKGHNFSQNKPIVHDCMGKTLSHTPGLKRCPSLSACRSKMMITNFLIYLPNNGQAFFSPGDYGVHEETEFTNWSDHANA